MIRVLACDVGHGAGSARGREREEKFAFGLEGGKPCGEGMRGAGADNNRIGWIERAARSVGMNDCDLRPQLERNASAIGEDLVNFDGDNAAVRADKFSENGRIIASATAEMKNVVSGMNVEQAQ